MVPYSPPKIVVPGPSSLWSFHDFTVVAIVGLVFPQEALISDVLLKPLLPDWASYLWPMVLLPCVFQGPALAQFYSLGLFGVVLVFG